MEISLVVIVVAEEITGPIVVCLNHIITYARVSNGGRHFEFHISRHACQSSSTFHLHFEQQFITTVFLSTSSHSHLV